MKTNAFLLVFSIKVFPFLSISHISHLIDKLPRETKSPFNTRADKIMCIISFCKTTLCSLCIYVSINNCCVVTTYKSITKICICNIYTADE